jgi:uncharacterized membrane protein
VTAAVAEPSADAIAGIIRGQIRSFDGTALAATATVSPGGRKITTDAEGKFELSLPPGQYTVRVRAFGFKSQNRRVSVSADGVTLLNVELRRK